MPKKRTKPTKPDFRWLSARVVTTDMARHEKLATEWDTKIAALVRAAMECAHRYADERPRMFRQILEQSEVT